MKKITVAVPDDVYRAANLRSAELGRSVSGLVVEYLRSLRRFETSFDRLEAQQRLVQQQIGGFRAGDRLDRDGLHFRAGFDPADCHR